MWVLDVDGNGINLDHVVQLKLESKGRRNSLTAEWFVDAVAPPRPGAGSMQVARLIDGVSQAIAESYVRTLVQQLNEEAQRL